MKSLLLSFLFMSTVVFAQGIKTKPVKCLFTSSGQVRSEFCTEMNTASTSKISGVCLYTGSAGIGVWKRGTWTPTKVGTARFSPTRICDEGVEYSQIQEEEQPVGPQVYGNNFRNLAVKSPLTSSLVPSNPAIQNRVPRVCYQTQNATNYAATKGLDCGSSIDVNGYCELKLLVKYTAPDERMYDGYWWVRYKDVVTRSFTICGGGATLINHPDEYPRYTQVDSTSNMLVDQDIKLCRYKASLTATKLTEKLCNKQSACGTANQTGCCAFTTSGLSSTERWHYYTAKSTKVACENIVHQTDN